MFSLESERFLPHRTLNGEDGRFAMSELVERLKGEVKRKGLTFNRIERELGLGNGTIKRWNDQSPRLDKLTAVAQYVGISLDYLVFGVLQIDSPPNGGPDLAQIKEEQGLLCDGSPLDTEETDLVAMYRLLPSYVREDMFDQVHCLYRKYAERKKESIYWTYFDESSDERSGPAEDREAHGGTA